MAFFGLFGRKSAPTIPLSELGLTCDMHSHLVPALDDGSDSTETSLSLITGLKNLGYKKLIITPHVMTGFYNNDEEKISKGFNALKKEVENQHIDIELGVGAEYYIDYDFMQDLSKKPMLTLGDSKMLLFECSFVNQHKNFDETVFEMQINGYKPVLAHPERYLYWHENIEHMKLLHDRGIMFQLNMLSLAKAYSPSVNKAAKELINNDLVDFIGTDLHNANHLNVIEHTKLSERTFEKLKNATLLNNTL
ncbi:MAG: hypothetical protein J5651_04760 [Salinivirgaceae bacterium]|nr:hypothetical protein [Salinivirgaceae bacterium]